MYNPKRVVTFIDEKLLTICMKIFDYNSMHRHLNKCHTLSSIKYALKHKLTHVNIG